MFPVIAAIPCMLGVATKYCQSEKTIVVALFYAPGTVILSNSLINKFGTFNGFSKRKILYFATCFCFVLALLLLALSFSFLISLLTNFSSGVANALKALDRAFLTFCLSFAEFVSLGIATSYGG